MATRTHDVVTPSGQVLSIDSGYLHNLGARRPGYARYVERTSGFFPFPAEPQHLTRIERSQQGVRRCGPAAG